MAVSMNLFHDFADLVRVQLSLSESVSDDDAVMLRAWFDLRRIPERSWTVERSSRLTTANYAEDLIAAVDAIETSAKSGKLLTGYMSKAVLDITNWKDFLLQSWGIYHLHLGGSPKNYSAIDKIDFCPRTGELLFVYKKNDTLYFIDIGDHSNFSPQKILSTLDAEWPHISPVQRNTGIHGLSYYPTDEQIMQLWKNQVNVTIKVNDGYFISASGITTSGKSAQAVRAMMRLKDYFKQTEDSYCNMEDKIKNCVETSAKSNTGNIVLKLIHFDPATFQGELVDQSTGAKFGLTPDE